MAAPVELLAQAAKLLLRSSSNAGLSSVSSMQSARRAESRGHAAQGFLNSPPAWLVGAEREFGRHLMEVVNEF
jgi:hypothetical protein